MNRFTPAVSRFESDRFGATLSEILISLMVMSIGVVSLATLFPISVLRSIQATQLTNATIHRLNAEQLIELYPRLIHNPDWPNNSNLAEHESEYSAGGRDNPDSFVAGGDLVNEGRFVVDPMGATHASLTPQVRQVFGNDAGVQPLNPIFRYHGGFDNLGNVQPPPQLPAPPYARNPYTACLADSWQVVAKGTSSDSTAVTTSITVPNGIDLTDAANASASGLDVRVVLFSMTGKQSVTRYLPPGSIDTALNTLTWADSIGGIAISRFRLETYEPRYSWLLTVRKKPGATLGQGDASVDVVVFHKRSFSAATEQRFSVSTWSGTDCTLNLAVAPSGTKPFLKKGGFLFDAVNAHWYRITQLKNEDTNNPLITLDRPLIAPWNPATNSIEFPKWVMAVPGIVEVYPLNTIRFDSSNPP